MLPAAHVGRMASRPKRAVTVGSTAPRRPPNQPAIAPSRRAREPNKAPRDTVLAATAAASVAWRLAVSTPWRYCCSYCSTWVRACSTGMFWAFPVTAARTAATAASRIAGSLPPVTPRSDCSIDEKGICHTGGQRRRRGLSRRLDGSAGGRGCSSDGARQASISAADQATDGGGQEIEDDEGRESPGDQAVPACCRWLGLARQPACDIAAGK